MGSCNFYLKAEFPNETAAIKVEPLLNTFFAEAFEAYEYYCTSWDDAARQDLKSSPCHKKFWPEFSKRFPIVMEYVKTLPEYKHNSVPGNLTLSFGEEDGKILRQYNTLCWLGKDTWRMADWSGLAKFIKTKHGATRVVYGSEDTGIASLESLNLYDWESIVRNILKQKNLLPLLLHIHEDLDTLLEQKMKT
jgi:hypothetical protein